MSHILLATKLHIPQLKANLVRRPQLVTRLQNNLDKKLILLSTPAGYGKTTLISEWLLTCGNSAAWIALDQGDNDPARFWTYLSNALQSAYPSLGASLSNNPLPGNLPALETNLTDTINELDKNNQQVILVLDDYYQIQSQIIHDGVAFLINNAPASFHVVLATRSDPPLPLAKLRGHSQMAEFRLADLRFSGQEIAEFMRRVMNLNLTQTDLSLLEETTEGWIAGLQMAGLSLQHRENASDFIRSFSGEDRYIMDFLFEEVFCVQSKKMQGFLLRTSILERLSAPLCNALTGDDDGQVSLAYLEQNNLFIIPLDEQRKWYRYHFLFRDLLRNRLAQSSNEARRTLHQRACVWYEDEGDLEIAISHALAAGDFYHTADIIEKISRTLDWQNQQTLMSSWLEELPEEVMEQHPWLCVYRAWGCYWTGQREIDCDPWLQTAEKAVEKCDDNQKAPIRGYIAAIRAHQALLSKDIPHVIDLSHTALELLPKNDGMRSEAAIALAGAYWAMGDLVQTKKAFGIARDAAVKINYRSMAAGASTFIALQQVKQGLLEDAVSTLQQGLRLATLPDGSEMPMAGFVNCHLGDIWREQNRLDEASLLFDKAINQCRRLGQPDLLCDAYVCYARYHLTVGDLDQTFHILEMAKQLARDSKVDPWIACWLDECCIKAWLANNNLEAVTSWMENSDLSADTPLEYQRDLHHQNLARATVARYRFTNSKIDEHDARLLLNRLQIAAKLAGWVHEEIKILVLKAINDTSRRDPDAAIQNLAHAVILAQPGRYLRVFLDEGDILLELFENMMELSNEALDSLFRNIRSDFPAVPLRNIKDYISSIISTFHETFNKVLHQQKMQIQTHPGVDASTKLTVNNLTAREMDVLRLLAKGFQDKKIADILVITRETVHKHLKNIYNKLDVHSRTEAVICAQTLGII